MDNITIDSSSFSEQLGIYDFFNVILSGTTFIGGLCIINVNLYNYIGNSFSLQKGIGLFLVIYILGMILQEIASILDSKIFNIYKGFLQLCRLAVSWNRIVNFLPPLNCLYRIIIKNWLQG